MIDQILQLDIRWDAVIAAIFIVGYLGVAIYNLWNNNRKL